MTNKRKILDVTKPFNDDAVMYNSWYKPWANTTVSWVAGDDEAKYKTHLKEKYDELARYNWIDTPIDYTFNSNGFRCAEFTSDPTLMTLGCSYTVGIGLPVESIWSELLAKKLDMRCANLGQGGMSNDTAFRLCHGWIDIVKPKVVVFFRTFANRLELLTQNMTSVGFGAWNNTIPENHYLLHWFTREANASINAAKNTMAIQHLCRERNIPLYIYNAFETLNDCHTSLGFENQDLARDLMHYGKKSHAMVADQIYNDILNNNTNQV
jgi:hypothetical protein